jgi:DNA-binding MarR family transcriptional regulator
MAARSQHLRLPTSREVRADLSGIVDSIRSIIQTLRVAGREAEQKLGISGAQLFILQALRDNHELSINELAELTFTHQSSVSMVVTRLVGAKLVTRRVASKDARRVVVALTPAGRNMLKRAPDAGQSRLLKALRSMPRSEMSSLARNLATLTHLVESQTGSKTGSGHSD